eukprot:2645692-Rhodomonas_salina.5
MRAKRSVSNQPSSFSNISPRPCQRVQERWNYNSALAMRPNNRLRHRTMSSSARSHLCYTLPESKDTRKHRKRPYRVGRSHLLDVCLQVCEVWMHARPVPCERMPQVPAGRQPGSRVQRHAQVIGAIEMLKERRQKTLAHDGKSVGFDTQSRRRWT